MFCVRGQLTMDPLIPQSKPPATLNVAIEHHKAGRFREAEELYRQILSRGTAHRPANSLLGILAHQVERNEVAAGFDPAVGRAQVEADVLNNLGMVLRDMGQLEEAIEVCRRAIALDASQHEALIV